MARRIARGNGDRFGFVDWYSSVEVADDARVEGMEVDGILIEVVQPDPDIFGGFDPEYEAEEGYDFYEMVVSAPYTYDGWDIARKVNSIDGVIAESEFESVDWASDDEGAYIHVVVSNGSDFTGTEDEVDADMKDDGFTDDDIVSINGAPWPFDGYRR